MSGTTIKLLVTSSCQHCAAMKSILDRFRDMGEITEYEIINVEQSPEISRQYGVRSVPWLQLGELEFVGSHSAEELEPWLPGKESATLPRHFAQLLESGSLAQVSDRVRRQPDTLPRLLSLMTEPDSPIAVQLGIGAVMESLEGSSILVEQIDLLARLAANSNPRIRADACHYLGLTGNTAALPALQICFADDNADVREIARDSVDAINEKQA